MATKGTAGPSNGRPTKEEPRLEFMVPPMPRRRIDLLRQMVARLGGDGTPRALARALVKLGPQNHPSDEAPLRLSSDRRMNATFEIVFGQEMLCDIYEKMLRTYLNPPKLPPKSTRTSEENR